MDWFEIVSFIILIITHSLAYYMGANADPEPFRPSNEAWVAVKCHEIDEQYKYARWLNEHETAAPSGDQ